MNRNDFHPNRCKERRPASRKNRLLAQPAKVLFLVSILLIAVLCSSFTVPNPQHRWVIDQVGVLRPDLEERIRVVNETLEPTGAQIAVAAIRTLKGEDLETVANETFRAWGIGDKTKNNGVLVLFAIEERKIRVEVGYGLEDVLPDGLVGRMIRNDIVPAFRNGDYSSGVEKLLSSLLEKISSKYSLENSFQAKVQKSRQSGGGFASYVLLILFVLLPILSLSRRKLRGSDRDFPTDAGRGAQWAYTLYWILTVLLSGSGGSGGGRSSGGGSSGGFGGGSSGGGGASGGW